MFKHGCAAYKLSQRADFLVGEKVALTHVKQQQCIWLEVSNAFDCVSQKENILLNAENKKKIGVFSGLGSKGTSFKNSKCN
jgi:hypothetical protein